MARKHRRLVGGALGCICPPDGAGASPTADTDAAGRAGVPFPLLTGSVAPSGAPPGSGGTTPALGMLHPGKTNRI